MPNQPIKLDNATYELLQQRAKKKNKKLIDWITYIIQQDYNNGKWLTTVTIIKKEVTMTNQQYEYYNWGQDVKRVFAGVSMDDAFGALPHYTDKELQDLGFEDRDDALDKLALDYTITE